LQIGLFVSTQSTNVTGGQTHGQTDRHRMTAKVALAYAMAALSVMWCQFVPCHAWQNGVNSKSVMTCTSMLDVKIIMALIITGQRQLKCKNLERKLGLF